MADHTAVSHFCFRFSLSWYGMTFMLPDQRILAMNNDKNIRKDELDDNWAENLKDDLEKLDTDFPLSGGEEPLTELEDDDLEDMDNEEEDRD